MSVTTNPRRFPGRWWCFGTVLLIGALGATACVSKSLETEGSVAKQPAQGSVAEGALSVESDPEPVRTRAASESSAKTDRSTRSAASGTVTVVHDPVAVRGAELFEKHCVICHGESGDGAGKFAYLMNPRPRNFQEGKFKLATTLNTIPSEEDLIRTIGRGMPGSAMPPWGHLPLTDLQALARNVRRIHVDATREALEEEVAQELLDAEEVPTILAQRTRPADSLVVPPESPFESVRWFRGRSTYLEACASCHGADGHPVASAVKFDNEGYPVPPRSFVNGIFKGGSEGYQLYARISKGMPGTPMPAYEGSYTDDEVWDLIHYVQSLARAGAQERAQLREGTIVAPNVRGSLPESPVEEAWDQARPVYVGLTPLWWTEDRVEGVVVRALHNGTELAVRLSWIDPTVDERAVRHDEFRDGVAIQFSLTSDPPFYMGDANDHGGVNIWFWKADRQANLAGRYQDVDAAFPNRVVDMYPEGPPAESQWLIGEWPLEDIRKHDPLFITAWGAGNLVADPNLTTPVECLVARGPGTLSGKPSNVQLVQGQAVWERGVWHVQMQRSMKPLHEHGDLDERIFESGDYLPISFAIWNGSAGDRDGKKNISIWQKLVIQ